MAVEALSYQGINRALSDYSGARACEELINLRPTTEGLVPVKDFSTKLSNVAYKRIFVHHSTKGDHLIAVLYDGSKVSVQWVDPATPVELFSVTATGSTAADIAAMQERIAESISFAAAGNVLLFSVCDKEDGTFANYAYTFKLNSLGNLAYVETEANVPNVTFSVGDGGVLANRLVETRVLKPGTTDPDELVSTIESGLNEIMENAPELCLGPVIIAIAFKSGDDTFWTSGWKVYDPTPLVNTEAPRSYLLDENSPDASSYAEFIQAYGHGYMNYMVYSGRGYVIAYGTNVTLTFTQLNTTNPSAANYWNKDSSIIQSVEVYTSRPSLYMDISLANEGFKAIGVNETVQAYLPQREYADMELGNQLLYHQASIPMTSLAEAAQTVKLTFGGNQQAAEEVMDADAGRVRRYGKVLSYNARFHYFDSVSQISLGGVTFAQTKEGTQKGWKVLVRYEDDDQAGLYRVGASVALYTDPAYLVIAPTLNVKEVIAYSHTGSTRNVRKYRMSPSSTYNYSYCDQGPYDSRDNVAESSDEIVGYDAVTGNIVANEEPAAINVTEQYNPFVFRVEHSYLAPGNILDIKPQMAGIVDSSYGRDPLNVFTVRGVYALTQGSANVLYGAFLPICDDVISAASIPTEMGIFFLADGALWLVTGRKATLVSDALHLGPHKFIRKCRGYQKIAGVDAGYDPSSTVSSPVYDVAPYLSQVTFEEFVRGNAATGAKAATLSFNRFRMELFVSSRSYPYSYVLSLKYRQWYKLSRQLWQDQPGETILSTPYGSLGNISVLDTSLETDAKQRIHLQTRPFSFGYSYAHVHRSVAMIRAELPGVVDGALADSKLVAALYGSDDLQNWKLLAYATRNGGYTETTVGGATTYNDVPLKFSQIRTTSSARSWRYYTFCIGGDVYTDKDIDLGPVIVDFEPVIRRIG